MCVCGDERRCGVVMLKSPKKTHFSLSEKLISLSLSHYLSQSQSYAQIERFFYIYSMKNHLVIIIPGNCQLMPIINPNLDPIISKLIAGFSTLRVRPVEHRQRVQNEEALDSVTNCLRDSSLSLNHEHQDLQLVRPSPHLAIISSVGHPAQHMRL